MKRVLAIALLALLPGPAWAAEINGKAEPLDGDKIVLAGKRVKLWGIEAVERGQDCVLDRQKWDCYGVTMRMLATLLEQSGVVTCVVDDQPDQFNRYFGRCKNALGVDIGEKLVRDGWALARRKQTAEYNEAEAKAKAEKAGLWKAQFAPPWEWRMGAGIAIDDP